MISFDDIYKTLQEELTPDWVVGRTVNRSCITLKNIHISEEIQRRTRTDIKVQFWSSDTKNLKFEFASDKQYIELRERLASSFEEYIFTNNHPTWLRKSKVKGCSTVAIVCLSDKDNAAAKVVVKDFYIFISNIIKNWDSEVLTGLLSRGLSSENRIAYPNDQPQSNSYFPTKEEFETAYRMLTHLGNAISIDTVLDQIESITMEKRLELKSNWRMITEKNIEIWSKK